MSERNQDYWTIKTTSLIELINGKRKRTNKSTIDNGTIKTRLTLKAQGIGLSSLNFSDDLLELADEQQIVKLSEACNQLFDLNISRTELDRYLTYHNLQKEKEADTNERSEEIVESNFTENEGFVDRVKRLFKGASPAGAAR